MDRKYKEFVKAAVGTVGRDNVYTDDLRRVAWGADAGFYHKVPQVVVRSRCEDDVVALLGAASRLGLPVTFRAAGTSLSGQSVSDSILIVAGKHWEDYTISPDASYIELQPGIVGNRVNQILAPYGRMFSPDPASKNSAMVGGIVINNASGMNCGTHANSDRVLRSARIVLADGTVLDTGDRQSRDDFRRSHPEMLRAIERLRDDICSDIGLAERIRYKYSIKNVTGLNLLPFVTFKDPFDIIAHCMVGSEGTLAFLSRVTVDTSHLYPESASAMLYFSDLREACNAVLAIKDAPTFSAELLDSKSLESVDDKTGHGLTALLVETKADSKEGLDSNIADIMRRLDGFSLYRPAEFTSDPAVYSQYWKLRSGIFPSVGGTRRPGTTVLIEDVAFHIKDLPDASVDLQRLLAEHGYDDACIYGHVLEGNYHFIISQSFDTSEEVERYKGLMEAVERLVVDKYDGSLKAEHGTGRNMAPFVRKEWGDKAWHMMRRLKDIFDPEGILNPGVIFNDDPDCYIKGMKAMPLIDRHVDRCIECGFCEVNCVSCGLTLSARQRIVTRRHMAWLRTTGKDPDRLRRMERQFRYYGNETCAGDGLCSTSCPMSINTGEMIHDLRRAAIPKSGFFYGIGRWAARNMPLIEGSLRPLLSTASAARKVIGDGAVTAIGKGLHGIGLPLWTPALPKAYYPHATESRQSERKVVYFPSCINRTMGITPEKCSDVKPLVDTVVGLCAKAGWQVVFPEDMRHLCCGMIWESKGMPDIADDMTARLEQALLKASDGGRYPVMCDQSPCLHRMRGHIKSLRLYEPAEFIHDFLTPGLDFLPVKRTVAVHVTCSSRLMGLSEKIVALARMCSDRVVVPDGVGCCGFAGDKGFTHPELNRYGLRKLRPVIEREKVTEGYSNSRTCEIGLTANGGIPYKSIAYLVDECTVPKKK